MDPDQAGAADRTVRDPQPWGARPRDDAHGDGPGRDPGAPPPRLPVPGALLVLIGTALGLYFSAVSTRDFTAHLDRQIHGVSCSFAPGLLGSPDASGTSGCHATLMSPWSSLLRERVWGGIPIALLSMGTFAFLAFAAVALVLTRRQGERRATFGLFLASLVPVGASLFWGSIAAFELGAACKVCIGIYVASAVTFAGALMLFLRARRRPPGGPPVGWAALAGAAVLFGLFVMTPAVVYVAAAPSHARFVERCGTLDDPLPPGEVTVNLSLGNGPRALEVLDPLCPACRAFDDRLEGTDVGQSLPRSALLFPLDAECNWMVSRSIHPGACTVSEAMICAEAEAAAVLEWAFAHQRELLELGSRDPAGVRRRLLDAFPDLRGCVGRAEVRATLNRGLRWAVDQRLPVLTPQLYVSGQRLCDEDTDLGLEYALPRLAGEARGTTSPPQASASEPSVDAMEDPVR